MTHFPFLLTARWQTSWKKIKTSKGVPVNSKLKPKVIHLFKKKEEEKKKRKKKEKKRQRFPRKYLKKCD